MRATKRDIIQGLKAIKKMAFRSFHKNDIPKAIHFIDAFSNIAGQFNLFYSDYDIEQLLKAISSKKIVTRDDYTPEEGKWVLYDDFCTTYVLGLQWLEALASSGKDVLYITTRDIDKRSRHKNILSIASQYENVETVVIPQGDILERAQRVYDVIIRFRASKLVLHKYATQSVSDFVLPVLPQGVTRYLINLSDQTFWLGCKSIDYCLEFRPFGASVSLQRRGLNEKQLLMVPFYPADDGNDFAGFPPECTEGKVIVFSGGDYYKTLDKDRKYWKLVKELLTRYPQVVFLFATKNIPEGDAEIHQFIKENHFEKRFIYIQFRPDIYQVFAHCDIYMGTCPTSGSLMSQLAAIHAKPILQYYSPETPDDETEQAICINDSFSISFNDKECFFEEARKLIEDIEYRHQQGSRLQKSMMQHEQFDHLVLCTLRTNRTQIPIHYYPIDYSRLDNRWYYLESAGYIHTIPYIYSLLTARCCLIFAPSVFVIKNANRLYYYLLRDEDQTRICLDV